jgi:hypothetical protein
MDLHATTRPGIAWPFFVGLIAMSLSGRFAAPPSHVGYYHEEKAT